MYFINKNDDSLFVLGEQWIARISGLVKKDVVIVVNILENSGVFKGNKINLGMRCL